MTSARQAATAILRVDGMGDLGRAQQLRLEVDKLEGVLLVDINYILDNVTISYNPAKLTLVQIKKRLDLGDYKTNQPTLGKAVSKPR